MSRLGPLSLTRIQTVPADALRALRMIPEIVEGTRAIVAHTAQLADVSAALERVADDTAVLPSMRDEMTGIAAAMPVLIEVQQHLAQLPETMGRLDDGIDRLSELMEKILVAVDGLNATVETLQAAVEPMGRLARRVPGQRKA